MWVRLSDTIDDIKIHLLSEDKKSTASRASCQFIDKTKDEQLKYRKTWHLDSSTLKDSTWKATWSLLWGEER
jgi:hypothetical protein